MTPISKWCVVSNVSIEGLEELSQASQPGPLHVYMRGPRALHLPLDVPFTLNVRTLQPNAASATGTASLRVTQDSVTVHTSPLNEDPVYFVADRMRGRFAYFTDLLLASLILPALGRSAEIVETPSKHELGTLVSGVTRLPHGTVTRSSLVRRNWTTTRIDEADPLAEHWEPWRDDPNAAGEAQVEALTTEIDRITTETTPGTRFATLLSGGIDSGTVTYLAAMQGLPVTPFSVGTPWGDEFTEAADLCTHLGMAFEPIHLNEEQIISSIPEAVRWLGMADPEVVEVALTTTAVQRVAAIPADHVLLTGYGSDLMNAGLYRPFDDERDLLKQVLQAVDRTRRSNELSNRMPLAYDTIVHHPFWSWPVMRVALETAPHCKVREGREKYHLRTAMASRVPESVAWRKKIAVHHGGGLQQGVIARLEKETGHLNREAFYRACYTELLAAASEGVLEPPDPWRVVERAAHRTVS